MPPPRTLLVIAALVAVCGLAAAAGGSTLPSVAGLVAAGTDSTAAADSPTDAEPTEPTPSPSTAPAATRSAEAAASAADLRAEAVAALNAAVSAQSSGSVSVAALDVGTGVTVSAGAASGMWTASAYKLFVLETLLLKRQSSGGLSSSQQQLATSMIEQSDNEAGYSLFEAAGGRSALVSAAAAFGMSHTVPGRTDPTFTTTSGADYLKLLGNLVRADSPLNATSRAYILNLMTHVASDQRWGVGVVADAGTTFANKNGWLSIDNDNGTGEDDHGLWAVTSVGVVTVNGQQVLMAVFTQHQASMNAGVGLVQALAKALAPAVA